MSKLKIIHIVIIGLVLWILAGVGFHFLLTKPAIELRDKEKARFDAAVAAGGTQANVLKQQEALIAAQETATRVRQDNDVYMRAQQPNIVLGPTADDRGRGMVALWREQSEVLGPMLIKYIKSTKVELVSELKIPKPAVDPNAIDLCDTKYLEIDCGKIKVMGDFSQIMSHIRKWNQFKRLVFIEQPVITGASPYLVCEYNLKICIFPRVAADPNAIIELAGGGGAGTPGMSPIALPR
jgi:hypothetical protein